MPIKIVGLIHAGVRIPPGEADVARADAFYSGLPGPGYPIRAARTKQSQTPPKARSSVVRKRSRVS